jgi:hypothetical protein
MFKRTAALGTIAFAIVLSAFTASALAGNGNGGSHGNSATAPGQTKNDQTTTTASTSGTTSSTASATVSSHAKAPGKASGKGSASQNTSTSAGLKPTNATLKNQWAAASSNRTKRYGNGQTAGQIATRAGSGSAMLYGPGNSQPHKLDCGGRLVDVHALKAHAARCASATTQHPQTSTTKTPATTKTSVPAPTHGAAVSQGAKSSSGSTAGSAPAASTPAGGALGATAKSGGEGSGFGGVLGAVTTVGHGTLPFTGFPLWAAALGGVLLVLGGLALARRARPTIA